jgi:hypothetical protein
LPLENLLQLKKKQHTMYVQDFQKGFWFTSPFWVQLWGIEFEQSGREESNAG